MTCKRTLLPYPPFPLPPSPTWTVLPPPAAPSTRTMASQPWFGRSRSLTQALALPGRVMQASWWEMVAWKLVALLVLLLLPSRLVITFAMNGKRDFICVCVCVFVFEHLMTFQGIRQKSNSLDWFRQIIKWLDISVIESRCGNMEF